MYFIRDPRPFTLLQLQKFHSIPENMVVWPEYLIQLQFE